MARDCPKCQRSFENDLVLCPFCIVGLKPAAPSPAKTTTPPSPPAFRTPAGSSAAKTPTPLGADSEKAPVMGEGGGHREERPSTWSDADRETDRSPPVVSGMEPEEPKIAIKPAPPYLEGEEKQPPTDEGTDAAASVDIRGLMGPNVGMVLKERYRLEKLLGRGGFGRVYLAFDQRLQIKVAIKLIPSEWCAQPEVLEALEREARLAIRLAHPNIVRLFNLENAGGDNFIVMEYVPGENLSEFRRKRGKLTEAEVYDIAVQASQGLAYAHGERVVHRDIKPSNIILTTKSDGTCFVKMVDFGIAREVKDSISRITRQTSSGTPIYMSPEQLRGSYDHRTDIYSLGVTLYELLCGCPPFHQGGLESLMWQIMNESPRPIADVSDWFNSVLLKCLEKNKDRRWTTSSELLDALLKKEIVSRPTVRSRHAGGESLPQTREAERGRAGEPKRRAARSKERSLAGTLAVGAAAGVSFLLLGYAGLAYGPDAFRLVRERISSLGIDRSEPATVPSSPVSPAPTAAEPAPVQAATEPRPATPSPLVESPTSEAEPRSVPAGAPVIEPSQTDVAGNPEKKPIEGVVGLLAEADRAAQADRLLQADAKKALGLYDQILALDPESKEATSGKSYVNARRHAIAARQERRLQDARDLLSEALRARPGDKAATAMLESVRREQREEPASQPPAVDPAEKAAYLDLLRSEAQRGNRQILVKSWELFLDSYPNGPYATAAREKIQSLKEEMTSKPAEGSASSSSPSPLPSSLPGSVGDAKAEYERIDRQERLPADEEISLWQNYLARYRGEVMPEKYWVDQARGRLRQLLAAKRRPMPGAAPVLGVSEPAPPPAGPRAEPPQALPSQPISEAPPVRSETQERIPVEPVRQASEPQGLPRGASGPPQPPAGGSVIQVREPLQQIIERMPPAQPQSQAGAP